MNIFIRTLATPREQANKPQFENHCPKPKYLKKYIKSIPIKYVISTS